MDAIQKILDAWGWCTGTTQRDGMGREEGSKSLSYVRLFAAPWTIARQAPMSMELSRQEYWSGLPFPSPEDHPNPEIKPGSPALSADSLPSEPIRGQH